MNFAALLSGRSVRMMEPNASILCAIRQGQRCTVSSRIIVTDKIYLAFIEALALRMARIKVGDALAAGTHTGPVSSQAQLKQNLSCIEIGKAEGATLAAGGDRINREKSSARWPA